MPTPDKTIDVSKLVHPRFVAIEIPDDPSWHERFWSKVNKDGDTEYHGSRCWIWTAAVNGRGYGDFSIKHKTFKAHRIAYVLTLGEIPNGDLLDHLCRVPLCVNPAHLEPTSDRDNILRGNSPSAVHARQTHCHKGHPLIEPNLYHSPKKPNQRVCRICKTERDRRRWSKV